MSGSQRSLVWPEAAADNQLREVTALGRDVNGRLVVGTASAGVFFWDGKQTSTEPPLEKLKGDAVWSFLSDNDGLWLAGTRGIYFYKSGQLREVAPGVNARALYLSADNSRAGQVWCATLGSGLLRVSLDDQFGAVVSRFDIEQGLPSQRVFAVVTRRGENGSEQVIAATNRGVVRYQPSRGTPTVLPARVIGQRIHQQSELPGRLASGLSAEQSAAGRHGNQQPHFPRAVSVRVHSVRQHGKNYPAEAFARFAVSDGATEPRANTK